MASLATLGVAILIAWLPLQTPIAILVYQYGHAQRLAWWMLLAKDAFAAGLIVLLFLATWRRIRLAWFDWAALLYVGLIGVYSVVPWLLGSHISGISVFASIRELGVPVELYALGRLAVLAGADVSSLIRWFFAVAIAAAVFTVGIFVLFPASFWASTLDLVSFVRDVQGIPDAHTIWDISLVAHFGGGASTIYSRAVGPFSQPVGTAHYFVLPTVLAVAVGFWAWARRDKKAFAIALVGGLILALAVLTPISRGSWIAVGVAFAICALAYRRPWIVVAMFVLGGAVLLAVPASRNSITAFVRGTDASTADHAQALDTGLNTVIDNPLGLGVGQSGQFGQALASGDAAGAGVGENMYIELLVSVGPLGFLAFLAWMLGLFRAMAPSLRRGPPADWIVIGTAAAFVGYVVSAMFASPLMRFTTSATVWLVVGLCVGLMVAQAARLRGAGDSPGARGRPRPGERRRSGRDMKAGTVAAPEPSVIVERRGLRTRLETRAAVTGILAFLLLWMPLQTPIALIVFQYGHSTRLAQALLLAKDFIAAALILFLLLRFWRQIRLFWFDWLALAYVAFLVVYSIVPWILGSHLPVMSVVASLREFGLPVELYALGRLAAIAGVDVEWLLKWFLGVAAVAAAFTVFEYFFLPVTFWSSTMDLVTFVRVVQGVPDATSLGTIGLLGQFGVGQLGNFPRAVGPFTQPVGTGHYFVLPFVLSVALFFRSLDGGDRRRAAAIAAFGRTVRPGGRDADFARRLARGRRGHSPDGPDLPAAGARRRGDGTGARGPALRAVISRRDHVDVHRHGHILGRPPGSHRARARRGDQQSARHRRGPGGPVRPGFLRRRGRSGGEHVHRPGRDRRACRHGRVRPVDGRHHLAPDWLAPPAASGQLGDRGVRSGSGRLCGVVYVRLAANALHDVRVRLAGDGTVRGIGRVAGHERRGRLPRNQFQPALNRLVVPRVSRATRAGTVLSGRPSAGAFPPNGVVAFARHSPESGGRPVRLKEPARFVATSDRNRTGDMACAS